MKAKCARCRGESDVLFKNEHGAQARARWHVRSRHAGLGRHTKNIGFCIGERENAHRAQARAHLSKGAPIAGESSILPTRLGAHGPASEEHEHRAEARAPFSTKMCTVRRRERRGTTPARRPEAPPQNKHVFFIGKVYVRRTAPRRESHGEALIS